MENTENDLGSKPMGHLYMQGNWLDPSVEDYMKKTNPRSYKRLMDSLNKGEVNTPKKGGFIKRLVEYFTSSKPEEKKDSEEAASSLERQILEPEQKYRPLSQTELKRNELKELMGLAVKSTMISRAGQYISEHPGYIIPNDGGLKELEKAYGTAIDLLVNEMPAENIFALLNSAKDYNKNRPHRHPELVRYVSQNIVPDLDSRLEEVRKYVGVSSGYKVKPTMAPAMVN